MKGKGMVESYIHIVKWVKLVYIERVKKISDCQGFRKGELNT